MNLPKFADVKEQNFPCQEYPGTWWVFAWNGSFDYATFDEAMKAAKYSFSTYDANDCGGKIASIHWEASENDPRIGEFWFDNSYCHGIINKYGEYISAIVF